jgi:hypothetical protein
MAARLALEESGGDFDAPTKGQIMMVLKALP